MAQPPNDHNHNIGTGGHHTSSSLSLHPVASGEDDDSPPSNVEELMETSGKLLDAETPDQNSPPLSTNSDWDSQKLHNPRAMLPSTPPEQTLTNYLFDATGFIETMIIPGGEESARCFLRAAKEPPITPESLAELDMPRIINNPKLRQDVNFDRELSFRPNLDGEKGQRKVKLAEDYWKAMTAELYLYRLVLDVPARPIAPENEAYWQGILAVSQKRVANMFQAIRDILKTLVPDSDQKLIEERLEVDLIMREILNGMFDIENLGSWLAKVIKNHCAPMRDGEVDIMHKIIRDSADDGHPFRLQEGIRLLLTLLENMKLDVANHQIRHMRPLLVEDTVNFQRRYNAHRISIGKIDVGIARLWLEHQLEMFTKPEFTPTHVEALTAGLSSSLMFTARFEDSYPKTFYLDHDRLRSFRTELHARIYHTICKEVFLDLAPKQATQAELADATTELKKCVDHILITGIATKVENVAAEIMRLVLILEKKGDECDVELMDAAFYRLVEDIRTNSPTFKNHGQALLDRLLPRLQASVNKHINHPALRLQDELLPPAPMHVVRRFPLGYHVPGYGAICTAPTAPRSVSKDEDFIRRFTHVVVLHWQVWADLAYLAPSNGFDSSDDNDAAPTPQTSGSSSPTVPVAQAIYEPGTQWLPIGVRITDVPSELPTREEQQPGDEDKDKDEDEDKAVHSSPSSAPCKSPRST